MAAAPNQPDIEALTARYLLGPCNHTGTGYTNAQLRNPITARAEVICLHGPTSPSVTRIRTRLVLSLNAHCLNPITAYNEALAAPHSPYQSYLQSQTDDEDDVLPDRMKVEMLGRYMERTVSAGERRFLIDGGQTFPGANEQVAAIFEEEVAVITAVVVVIVAGGEESERGMGVVGEKLRAGGRLFMIDTRKSQREVDDDVQAVEETLKSISYMARLACAGDVFRGPPPPRPQ
ncbi:MAG: hypothetical protein LQ344_001819 [Seirophora lacunosa]|nr:MAG: hypothetical protein LQ344_001819 [Seirophora lacunosa]